MLINKRFFPLNPSNIMTKMKRIVWVIHHDLPYSILKLFDQRNDCKSRTCAHTWRVGLWHLCRFSCCCCCCYLSLADVIPCICIKLCGRCWYTYSLSIDWRECSRSHSHICGMAWKAEFHESRKVSCFSL